MNFSIVVPAYNEVGTIARVLPLVVAALPDRENEIIVVDDASTDGTADWLKRNVVPDGSCYGNLTVKVDGVVAIDLDRRPAQDC